MFGVCSLRSAVGQACESVSNDNPYTASELSALKTWLVRSVKETDCKVTDGGTHVKRVVTRDAAKVDNTDQLVVGWLLGESLSSLSAFDEQNEMNEHYSLECVPQSTTFKLFSTHQDQTGHPLRTDERICCRHFRVP